MAETDIQELESLEDSNESSKQDCLPLLKADRFMKRIRSNPNPIMSGTLFVNLSDQNSTESNEKENIGQSLQHKFVPNINLQAT